MSTISTDVLIVGAGLAGLTLAYELSKNPIDFFIVEAADTVGGRIKTLRPKGPESAIEMGATWFGPSHKNVKDLLQELNIEVFEQSQNGKALFQSMSFVQPQVFDLPQGQEPTYRVVNGSESMTQALVSKLDAKSILCGYCVNSIKRNGRGFMVEKEGSLGLIFAKRIVITTPPQVAAKNIRFPEEIDQSILSLMSQTHTWMNNSIKFALISEESHWLKMGYSGTFFSQVGPVVEMYDHSNKQQNFFALKGFLNGSVTNLSKVDREQAVRSQLAKVLPFFGNTLFEYADYNWADNNFVHVKDASPLYPHQNNGHQNLRSSIIENSIWLGGTETAKTHPGYMEGAVERAKELAELL
jgi:monoamine oxidase